MGEGCVEVKYWGCRHGRGRRCGKECFGVESVGVRSVCGNGGLEKGRYGCRGVVSCWLRFITSVNLDTYKVK